MAKDDLLDWLETETTEEKTPGESSKGVDTDFWDQKDAEEKERKKKAVKPEPSSENTENTNPENTENSDENKDPENNPRPKKLSKALKDNSAKTAAGMLDLTLKMILTPIISYKAKKKFTDEEKTKLDETNVCDADKKELEGDELVLRNKWDRIMAKHDRAKAKIPLTPDEKQDLENSFYNYMDEKEKELPSEWLIGLNIVSVIGKRVIDVAFD